MTRTESIVNVCECFESSCSEFHTGDRKKRYNCIDMCDPCYVDLSATMEGLEIKEEEIKKCFDEHYSSNHWRRGE